MRFPPNLFSLPKHSQGASTRLELGQSKLPLLGCSTRTRDRGLNDCNHRRHQLCWVKSGNSYRGAPERAGSCLLQAWPFSPPQELASYPCHEFLICLVWPEFISAPCIKSLVAEGNRKEMEKRDHSLEKRVATLSYI